MYHHDASMTTPHPPALCYYPVKELLLGCLLTGCAQKLARKAGHQVQAATEVLPAHRRLLLLPVAPTQLVRARRRYLGLDVYTVCQQERSEGCQQTCTIQLW